MLVQVSQRRTCHGWSCTSPEATLFARQGNGTAQGIFCVADIQCLGFQTCDHGNQNAACRLDLLFESLNLLFYQVGLGGLNNEDSV